MLPLLLLLRPAREIKTKITENRAIQRVNVVAVTSDKQTEPRHAQHILHFHFRMHKKKKNKNKIQTERFVCFSQFCVFIVDAHGASVHSAHTSHACRAWYSSIQNKCCRIMCWNRIFNSPYGARCFVIYCFRSRMTEKLAGATTCDKHMCICGIAAKANSHLFIQARNVVLQHVRRLSSLLHVHA